MGVKHLQLRMQQAKLLAEQAKCVRRGVGAVIISAEGDLLSEGYNGMFKGGDNLCGGNKCDREGLCSGKEMDVGCIHAEMNAILHCARLGRSTLGATMVLTTLPCHNCAKMIVQAGIVEVVVRRGSYPDERGVQTLRQQGVRVIEVDDTRADDMGQGAGDTRSTSSQLTPAHWVVSQSLFGVAVPCVTRP